MRYALTAMAIALIAAFFAWLFGASIGQVVVVYVVVGIAAMMTLALIAWLSGNLRRNNRRSTVSPTPIPAHKGSERP